MVRFAGTELRRAHTLAADALGNLRRGNANFVEEHKQRVAGHILLAGALGAHGTAGP